ncbi:hypothetical protein ACFQ0X_01345 [Streptomyces rectiviolaceus]|uniref:Uncharacterized protein n=1 Tax=Streptomyces rectiviolaceus TaxID=332591 RepID=A0ABP6M947_9ACTN
MSLAAFENHDVWGENAYVFRYVITNHGKGTADPHRVAATSTAATTRASPLTLRSSFRGCGSSARGFPKSDSSELRSGM